jgi:chromosome partitioning protein
MKTLAFVNSGGGQAKTSTCHSVGTALALAGKRVLLIDIDGQCSLSSWCGIQDNEQQHDLLDVLRGDMSISAAIRHTYIESCHILPASLHLYQAERHFADEIAADNLLNIALQGIADSYDVCCIDTPPQMGILGYQSMIAAKNLIIPVEASWKSLQAMNGLLKVINIMRDRRCPELSITGILPSRVDTRQTSCNQSVDLLRQNFGELVFDTIITDSVVMKDAFAHGKSVIDYAPDSKTTQQIKSIIMEINSRMNTEDIADAA